MGEKSFMTQTRTDIDCNISVWHEPSREKDAYMTGDKVVYEGKVYVSDIDYNVFQPNIFGWTESVED